MRVETRFETEDGFGASPCAPSPDDPAANDYSTMFLIFRSLVERSPFKATQTRERSSHGHWRVVDVHGSISYSDWFGKSHDVPSPFRRLLSFSRGTPSGDFFFFLWLFFIFIFYSHSRNPLVSASDADSIVYGTGKYIKPRTRCTATRPGRRLYTVKIT